MNKIVLVCALGICGIILSIGLYVVITNKNMVTDGVTPAPGPATSTESFPVFSDRVASTTAEKQDESQMTPPNSTASGPNYAPGGLEPMTQYHWQIIDELRRKSQKIPLDNEAMSLYLIADTDLFKIQLEISHKPPEPVIDITLKKRPYTTTRLLAESALADAFEGTRADLCGFPVFIHSDSEDPLSEKKNFGFEHCGANELGDAE